MARRLGEDGVVGGPAAAARRPAAAVEDAISGDPGVCGHGRRSGAGPVDLPLRGQEAAVLARVGVADHHRGLARASAPAARVSRAARVHRSRARRAGRRSSRTAAPPTAAPGARHQPARRPACRRAVSTPETISRSRRPRRSAARASRASASVSASRRSGWRTRSDVHAQVEPGQVHAEQLDAAPQRAPAGRRRSAPPRCARRLASIRSRSRRSSAGVVVARLVAAGQLVVQPAVDGGQLAPVRLVGVALADLGATQGSSCSSALDRRQQLGDDAGQRRRTCPATAPAPAPRSR